MVQQIKKKVKDKNVEIEEIDIGDKTIAELDSLEIADYYIRAFNNIIKMGNGDETFKELLKKYMEHFNNIRMLYIEYKEYPIEYGKYEVKMQIHQYINSHYFDITEFVTMYRELEEE